MTNTCNFSISTYSQLLVLNHPCYLNDEYNYQTTTISFSVLAACLVIIAAVLYFALNSVQVLRHEVKISAVSNIVWFSYVSVASIRAIILAIAYSHTTHSGFWILANWIVGSFELFALCIALRYQLTFRSNVNPDAFKQGDHQLWMFVKAFKLHEKLLTFTFFLIFIVVMLFRYERHVMVWFWIYFSFTLLLLLCAIVYTFIICFQGGFNQPSIFAKVSMMMAVILIIPERIPIYFWAHCMGSLGSNLCWRNSFDLYDVFLILKLMSGICIFCACIKEYFRFKEDAQFTILKKVSSTESNT